MKSARGARACWGSSLSAASYHHRRRNSVETLRAQRLKLQHARERLVNSFTEGLIEKDQFTSQVARTKTRIAELDTKIKDDAGDVDHLEYLRLAAFFRTFGEGSPFRPPRRRAAGADQAAYNTRIRSKSSFARPDIWRLISFNR